MNKSEIMVSIIVPTYKRPVYLPRAISSVLNQSFENFELIIVDDNNANDKYRSETELLISSYKDDRIQYIKHEINRGGSAARNTGIKHAKGKYITFLDDDDQYLVDKIREQFYCMETLGDDWVACYTLFIRYQNDKMIDRSADCKSGELFLDFFKNELYINAGSNLFIRADIVKKINGFDESFKRMQDLEFAIRVAEMGKVKCIDKYLLKINMHENQILISYEKLTNFIDHFLNNFESRISILEKKDRIEVYQSKYLDLLKRLIIEKNFREVNRMVKKKQVSIILVLNYLFYLLKRKLTKKCYGYKFSNSSQKVSKT